MAEEKDGTWVAPHQHRGERAARLFPVGSIYLTTALMDPNSFMGFGVWEMRETNFHITGHGSPEVFAWLRVE